MEEARKKFSKAPVGAFLCGAAMASIVTLLTAPASGKTTRKRLASKARSTGKIVQKGIVKAERKAEKAVNRLQKQAKSNMKRTSKQLAKRANVLRHAAEEQIEQARHSLHLVNGNGRKHA